VRRAFLAALTLHAGALALLVAAGAPRLVDVAPDEGAGIAVVFSSDDGEAPRDGATPPSQDAAERAPAATQGEAAADPVAPQPPPEPVTAEESLAERSPRVSEVPLPAITAPIPLPPPAPPQPPPSQGPRARQRASVPEPPFRPAARGEAASASGGGVSEAAPVQDASAPLLVAARPATISRRVNPVVPIEARRARIHGTVVLAVTVSPDGIPSAVDVHRSSGHLMLDRAAQEALWQWRFDPAQRGGVPVEERIAVPITFRIVD
jgi:protein TonB